MPIAMRKEEEDACLRRSNTMNFKKLVPKVLRSNSMKNLFKSKKPRPPVEVVRETRKLLVYIDSETNDSESKRNEKVDLLLLTLMCFSLRASLFLLHISCNENE